VTVTTEVLSAAGATLLTTVPQPVNPAPYAMRAARAHRADAVGTLDDQRGWQYLGGNRIVFNYYAGGSSGIPVPACERPATGATSWTTIPIGSPPWSGSGSRDRFWAGTATVLGRYGVTPYQASLFQHLTVWGQTYSASTLATQCVGTACGGEPSDLTRIERFDRTPDEGFFFKVPCTRQFEALSIHMDLYSRTALD